MARRTWLVSLLVVLVAGALAACGQATPNRQATGLRVDVAEWSIVPSVGVVSAGRVRITVRNLGAIAHSLTVARTARFGADLPLRGDHAVAQPVVAPVLVAPGASRSFVVRLAPGSYVLLDNLPWHYWEGTSVAIAVR